MSLPSPPLLKLVADQLEIHVDSWDKYGQREQTRREHLVELQMVFGFHSFTTSHQRQIIQWLTELAMQTDKGIVLINNLIEHLRRQSIILPALNAIERIGAEAITRANRRIYDTLGEPLSNVHRHRLDDLLKRRDTGTTTWPAWLRQSPVRPNSRHMLALTRIGSNNGSLNNGQGGTRPPGISQYTGRTCLLLSVKRGRRTVPVHQPCLPSQAARSFNTFFSLGCSSPS